MQYQSLLLWSINERLAGKNGLDFDPLDDEWVEDIFHANEHRQATLGDLFRDMGV